MKQITWVLLILIIFGLMLAGCSSSEETQKEELPPSPPVVEKPVIKQQVPVVKKIDTVNIDVQNAETPKYEPKVTPPPPPESIRSAVPLGKFSVQIGAYKMPDNADRIGALAKERFGLKVYTAFDETDNLYKVMIGDFETKDSARSFRDAMSMKYPEEYKDAWVSENPQK